MKKQNKQKNPVTLVSLNLQLNNQKHNQNNCCKKNAVIKPAAQQGFWRHAHLIYTLIFQSKLWCRNVYLSWIKFGSVRYEDVCTYT